MDNFEKQLKKDFKKNREENERLGKQIKRHKIYGKFGYIVMFNLCIYMFALVIVQFSTEKPMTTIISNIMTATFFGSAIVFLIWLWVKQSKYYKRQKEMFKNMNAGLKKIDEDDLNTEIVAYKNRIEQLKDKCEELNFENENLAKELVSRGTNNTLDSLYTKLGIDKTETRNDFTTVKHLLTRFGVEFKMELTKDFYTKDKVNGKGLLLEEGREKVEGYTGFYCFIVFDKNNNFIKFDIGE